MKDTADVSENVLDPESWYKSLRGKFLQSLVFNERSVRACGSPTWQEYLSFCYQVVEWQINNENLVKSDNHITLIVSSWFHGNSIGYQEAAVL